MNKRLVYSLAAAAAIIVGTFLFFNHRNGIRNRSSEPLSAQIEENAVSPNGSAAGVPLVNNSDGSSNQPGRLERSVTASQPTEEHKEALLAAFAEYSKMTSQPIDFYGRVLDESNNPIADANISFNYNQFNPPNSLATNAISDQSGYFSLSGVEGVTLSVRVSKNGYYPISSNAFQFAYLAPPPSQPFHPDSANPVVFHLRKKGSGTDLVTAELTLHVPIDGNPINVDLTGDKGEIEISNIKPPASQWKSATEWSYTLKIPDGGFIEENEDFPFEAPESGYQPVVQLDFKQGQPDWAINLNTNYYIQFGTPPIYGRIHIETSIMTGTSLQYFVNPTGSRNLEPAN